VVFYVRLYNPKSMGISDHIALHNDFTVDDTFLPLCVGSQPVGVVSRPIAELLGRDLPGLFDFHDTRIAYLEPFGPARRRLGRLAGLLGTEYGITPPPRGEELTVYPLGLLNEGIPPERVLDGQLSAAGVCNVDRNATSPLGIVTFGVMLVAYVRGVDNSIRLLLGRRSRSKPAHQFPGKLDPLAAGAIPTLSGLKATLCAEALEEAGLPYHYSMTATLKSHVSYLMRQHSGVKNQVLFVYDLELPPYYSRDWRPHSLDGSVEDFVLMSANEAAHRLQHTQDFKGGSDLVLIDFLIRHGHIRPGIYGPYSLPGALRRRIRARRSSAGTLDLQIVHSAG